jgi:hypothetical protein
MPVQPNFLERLVFLTANLGPGPMLDLVGALGFKATLTALRLGVFEALSGGPRPASALAAHLGTDTRGLALLLEALRPLGFVATKDGGFCNTPMTEKWLLQSSPTCIAELYEYFDGVMAHGDLLAESIRRGEPAVRGDAWYGQSPSGWRPYQAGMRAIARLLAPELLEKVVLPRSAHRLLDLGGGHGLYSVRFCRKYPQLEATVLDWGSARDIACETIAAEAMQDRIVFREGDILKDDLGQGYDVVLLFNVARAFSRTALDEVLRKVAGALSSGGMIVILDQLVRTLPTPFLTANARLIELELFNSTPQGIHDPEEIVQGLRAAGFGRVTQFALRRSGGQGVIVAHH